ncbi:DUF2470 domain-containing protein [Kitasatospora sp. NBC_00240]|uniref:DUF2470 domain-containing protein n=1 Tax=Kitasatospora sp. NBC_00240 TaxID=2903567 RepID=UPI002258B4EB|nr:DUF2470 domain-containing protein [Kitasatospora sp. NBC_00240]MCX5213165.1 DUF2470 domain-containing protein [Kitasatospora sp. NBC_00240]
MRPTDVSIPTPTDAERVRSALRAASSLTATTRSGRHDLLGPYLLGFGGAGGFGPAPEPAFAAQGAVPHLQAPRDCRLTHEAAEADEDGVPVLLEWTDVAPVAVRDRIRCQVRIAGRLGRPREAQDGTVRLPLDPTQALLGTAGTHTPVDLDGLARTAPDPLAPYEAALLTHMTDDHHDQVAALSGLVDPRLLIGVTRVWPLALDQYGIVLRLETLRTHHDVRLPFERPLLDPDEVGHRIHALLHSANRVRTRRLRLHTERR